MKTVFVLFTIALVICSIEASRKDFDRHRPYINRPTKPTPATRFRRSPEPEPQGSIVYEHTKPLSGPDRRPSWNLDYKHNIYQGRNGEISASGGAIKLPGRNVQPHVGVQGTWRFRRSPEPQPQGSIVYEHTKPLSGPDRRPSWNLDYKHNIYQGRNGEISASGGAIKLPGRNVQPHVGVQGTWRFRRSTDEDELNEEQ